MNDVAQGTPALATPQAGFDVFALRDRVVGEYREYVESFVHILDPRLREFVNERLAQGELWPEAVLQLNPAYESGPTLGELARRGTITAETARFFGVDLRLHKHQEQAIEAARRNEPYIVSTGTGSGKSLTYLIPIVDRVFRDDPTRASVRALVIYPMNALINSQVAALKRFKEENWKDAPIRFAEYTGQTRDEARRAILEGDPPHILLTNYVMLEYLLIRPAERSLLHQATRQLGVLAVDELHVYRGRQGADVAMLIRRLRERVARPDLLCIGTSATLATDGTRAERHKTIAQVGTTLFGVTVPPINVIDETLRRIISAASPEHEEALRAAVQAEPPPATLEAVARHPLAAWVESTFGLRTEDSRLVRARPLAFADGVKRLTEVTGLPEHLCRDRLQAVLLAGNEARVTSGEPLFAFRLHQFLSSGSSVYTTFEPPDRRVLTTEGQFRTGSGGDGGAVLFPLAFCRECGQEHYLANLVPEGGTERLLPRSSLLNVVDEELPGERGYVVLQDDDLWGDDEGLPDNWLEMRRNGARVKARYAKHQPRRLWVSPDGLTTTTQHEGAIEAWWQPAPLMLCLRCRAAYDLRETSDFRKLATLSQIGRSTATTVLATATVAGMRGVGDIDPSSRKILSFTDNRQDAALQAGHLNDFVQVVQLRGALVRALGQHGALTFDRVGTAIFDALAPAPGHFMREPVPDGPGYAAARHAMIHLLQYRAFEDLARAWRIAQPNLEQTGLLCIEYEGLAAIAADRQAWQGDPVLAAATPERREAVLRALLDHMRSLLAIDAKELMPDETEAMVKRVNANLRDPWAFDDRDRPRTSTVALLPGFDPNDRNLRIGLRLGSRSAIGRYLRSRRTWDIGRDLDADGAEHVVLSIFEALRGHLLSTVERRGEIIGVQVRAAALRWLRGDGKPSTPDPVRTRALHLRRPEYAARTINRYFVQLYRDQASEFAGLYSGEHTGHVRGERRIKRERDFRDGTLKALFCSPTMELGVDISDLYCVHMRNLPPTPANYAQRSGRAGRGGRPALVLAFSGYGNAHDQHFFRRPAQMIAGAVAPPRIDLINRELVEAHLRSIWVATTGIPFKNSMRDVLALDPNNRAFPLKPDIEAAAALSETRFQELMASFRDVADKIGPAITTAPWWHDGWLEQTARNAKAELDRAFERWRDLYRAALDQRNAARLKIDDPNLSRREREDAERQEREAKREIELLLNQSDRTESDFYPYRYLANEGFIPGYNFPRLPLRALVSTGDEAEAIERPRFLGLAEFGPGNTLYYEGRKYRVRGCVVPSSGLEQRLGRAKFCRTCGHAHPAEASGVDLCAYCGTQLDGSNTELTQRLLDQPTVRLTRWQRISSEEEERAREGYRIVTYFHVAPGTRQTTVSLHKVGGEERLLTLAGLPMGEIWRVNHGWRRASEPEGFTIDQVTGRWGAAEPEDEPDEPTLTARPQPLAHVRPYVRDRRNLLFLTPRAAGAPSEPFLKTLSFAMRRAIQTRYQIEEQEIAVELIGDGSQRRILLWEAAEGGIGAWDRLLADPGEVRELARQALRLIHVDPDTGEHYPGWEERCPAACYECLLSYSNQADHRLIDRNLIREYLLDLTRSEARAAPGGRDYEEHYRWLLERIDPASNFERAFLDALHARRLRLPDFAQHRPAEDLPAQPDFYYARDGAGGICVFIDGPQHASPEATARDRAAREALANRGYRVIAIVSGEDLADQINRYRNVFVSMA